MAWAFRRLGRSILASSRTLAAAWRHLASGMKRDSPPLWARRPAVRWLDIWLGRSIGPTCRPCWKIAITPHVEDRFVGFVKRRGKASQGMGYITHGRPGPNGLS